ncbi:MAG: hypothetical protein K2K92_05425 [Duncaniella sp.]|nr:hypothetical protein [Duncaniella sp.]
MKTKLFIAGAVALGLTVAGAAFATGGVSEESVPISRAISSLSIPGTLNAADWTYGGTGGIRFENEEKGVGYIKSNSIASIEFHCDKSGAYNMIWEWNSQTLGDDNVEIVVKDLESGRVEVDQIWKTQKGESTIPLEGTITEGDKSITFTITATHNSYLGNYFSPTFEWVSDTFEYTGVPTGWDVIPGELDVRNWTYDGMRVENKDGVYNVGYVTPNTSASHRFFCSEQGVYMMDIDFYDFYNTSTLGVNVKDRTTGKTEVDTRYDVTEKHKASILLPGILTVGKKDIEFIVTSEKSGFMFNYYTPSFRKVGDSFASVYDVKALNDDVTSVNVNEYDWAFNIPSEFSSESITFDVEFQSSTLSVSAEGAEVSELGGGKYSIPVPAPNGETIVTLAITPDAGAYSSQQEYKVRFFRIGGVVLTGLNINSIELDAAKVDAINKADGVMVNDYIFTTVPSVTATFIDGTTAEATASVEGAKGTFTFTGKSGDKSKTFSFDIDGIHLYTRTADDKEAKVVYNGSNKKPDDSWNNGLYAVYPCNDGWDGTQFKLHGNETTTLAVPSDMKVNQLVIAQLFDNYQNGKITSVKSGDATVWLPTESSFMRGSDHKYDLVVNVENHVAGTPFEIEIESTGQPVMWFEFLYETVVPTTAPELVSTSVTDLTGKNHAVVTYTMNREVLDTEITFNGQTVKGSASGVNLSFPIWDLDYATEYTLTVPAGKIVDTYGNKNTEPFICKFTTGVKNEDVVAIDGERFIVVSDVKELQDAVATLSETNKSASSPTTVIYILNGDYDLGEDLSGENYSPCLSIDGVYNVSLVGESQAGVLIHGTRMGITSPILWTRNSTNIYMENFTLRNDLDFGKARVNVGVAHYGGNLDIMKNVTLQSQQDTQVTGARGYYLNCTIHGTVDYICGGGDHFYDRCTFVQEAAGAITAPMTDESLKHGFVFQNCVIKGEPGYTLGRPWQNEPRCFWLNTTMHSLPVENGWGEMGNHTTHFFEHNSMDADGNPLDLSKRKNSATSTNTYSPILPEEYASYFTPRNVLGSTDSWDAEKLTAECKAPVVKLLPNSLKWDKVDGAAGYMVFLNGSHIAYTTSTGYSFESPAMFISRAADEKSYTVAAVSNNGARGEMSEIAEVDDPSALGVIEAEDAAEIELYNLQGLRVPADTKGTLIRVTVTTDGKRSAEKVIIK